MKGKRTMIFNGLIMTLGFIETADLSFLPAETSGPILIAVGIGGIWLRIITSTPWGQSK